MVKFLLNLEPIMFESQTVVLNELDTVDQVFFFTEGKIDVGYELNKKVKYKVRLSGPCCIGAFECSFKWRSLYIYKIKKDCKGFMIRKQAWLQLE